MLKYTDRSLPVAVRLEDLLARMTLKEKIGQLNQRMLGWQAYKRTANSYEITQAFKDEVALGDGLGALYGLFRADPWSKVTFDNGIPATDSAGVANRLQRYVIENTRLGIPLLFSEECPHGHMALDGSMFPTNLGMGSTWNPELLEEVFSCVAAEIRARGGSLGLASALDILQDPRWGRSEECYGEDPYLASRMAAAATKGLQGREPEDVKRPDRVAAVLKHFCAQGAAVGGHNGKAAVLGERELREIHLPAMEAGIGAGALGCMAAYNEIDGIYCHANRRLLTGILREEWGFGGVVMSDGCAVDNLIKIAGSGERAVAAAVSAGVDMNLWSGSYTKLEEAVRSGLISEELIDRAVRRVLLLKFRLGLFDDPYTDEKRAAGIVGSEAFRRVNLKAARESVVLLKNEARLLPFKKDLKRLAVIGPNADSLYSQLGDYTAPQREGTGTTVLQGIRAAVPQAEVIYAKGCGIRDTSREGFTEAVRAAAASDAVVLVLGGSSARNFGAEFDINGAAVSTGNSYEMDCGEGVDVAELELGGVQVALAKKLAATGKPMAVVLIQGRPHAVPWIAENCGAILCAWYPGTEGGKAIADILFGDVNACGKLPVSIPRSSGQLPVYYNHKDTGDYADLPASPLYPFGYGLSYTAFEYSGLTLRRQRMPAEELNKAGRAEVSVKVRNSGDREGMEIVQLYITGLESGISRRVKELKGFQKLRLAPGEEKVAAFELGKAELGIWDSDMAFAVAPGKIKITVGPDSATGLEALLEII